MICRCIDLLMKCVLKCLNSIICFPKIVHGNNLMARGTAPLQLSCNLTPFGLTASSLPTTPPKNLTTYCQIHQDAPTVLFSPNCLGGYFEFGVLKRYLVTSWHPILTYCSFCRFEALSTCEPIMDDSETQSANPAKLTQQWNRQHVADAYHLGIVEKYRWNSHPLMFTFCSDPNCIKGEDEQQMLELSAWKTNDVLCSCWCDGVTRAVTICPLSVHLQANVISHYFFLQQLSWAQCSANLVALRSMSLEACIRTGGNEVLPPLLSGSDGRDVALV